jgi:hypothetical protein
MVCSENFNESENERAAMQANELVCRQRRMMRYALPILILAACLFNESRAAGTIISNDDRNATIDVQDAMARGSGTQLLYFTRPDRSQAHFKEKCTINIHVLDLSPGLQETSKSLLAENFCSYFGMFGKLLANGDAVIVAGDRVETWRRGAGKVNSWVFGDVSSLRGRWNQINDGNLAGIPIDVDRQGNVFIARGYGRTRNDTKTTSGMVAAISSKGEPLWSIELEEPGVLLTVVHLWAAGDGGALLHITATPMSGAALPGIEAPQGANIMSQDRLYRVSPDGRMSSAVELIRHMMPDFSAPAPQMPDPGKDPEAYQKALNAHMERQSELSAGGRYLFDSVAASPGQDGAMDVLVGRNSDEARLIRLDRDGRQLLDVTLDEAITSEGLHRWVDFVATEDQVVLFGTVGTRANRLSQGYMSWISLDDGSAITRLAPLSELGLAAAQEAGDEELQYLEHNPAQQPQLLTRLGGRPLSVSLVRRSRRAALQIDEGSDQLLAFTEAREGRETQAAKQAQSDQRKAQREARKQQMNADMAAAVGMTPEEYAALSNKERKEVMVRQGDFDAMQAAAARQAQAAQQSMPAQQDAMPGDMNAQIAAAMAEAQEKLANDPDITPEMRAQMSAIIAQMGQSTGGQTAVTPGMPAAQPQPAPTAGSGASEQPPEDAVMLDANLRGFLEFENEDGRAMTLLIFNRQSGQELFKKDYPDGTIYEYVDFSRFGLPLEQIGVIYRDISQQILGEPVLVTAHQESAR